MTAPPALSKASLDRTEATVQKVTDALFELDQKQTKIPRAERTYPEKDILAIVNRDAPEGHRMSRSTLYRNQRARSLIWQYQNQGKIPTLERELRLHEYAGWRPPPQEPLPIVAKRRRRYLTLLIREAARRVACLEELKVFMHKRRRAFETILSAGPTELNNHPFPSTPFSPSRDEVLQACERWQTYINKLCKRELAHKLIELEGSITEDMEHLHRYDLTYE